MPCCAFAAVIVAQLLFGVRFVKRALFGADEASEARNPVVEWRLEPASARDIDPPVSSVRFLGRWSLRGLAVAAAVEAAIVVAVAYGFWGHAGHVAAHFAQAGHGVGHEVSGVDHAMLDRVQSASSSVSVPHD